MKAVGLALLLALAPRGAIAADEPGLDCIACEAPAASEFETQYSPDDWARMRAGDVIAELVKTEGGEEGRARASGIVPAGAAAIWAVLTDWESYPAFLPNVQETRLRRRDAGRAWISQHLRVMWNDIRYGVVWDMKPRAGRVRFALDASEPADIANTEGSWQLVPLPPAAGEETLVRYESLTDVGKPVPGFIRNALSTRSLPKVVRGVRDEVLRRAPKSPSR